MRNIKHTTGTKRNLIKCSLTQSASLIGCLLFLIIACKPSGPQRPPAVIPQVSTAQVDYTKAVYFDTYPGIVTPMQEVELRSQVSGYITGIHFTDGAIVSKGQVLYTIDQQMYAANVQQAKANLKVQEANLLKAQQDAERYRKLDAQNAIAKQQVDYAEASLKAAEEQVEASKAIVNSVQTNLQYATIKAPFTGTIGISNLRVGAAVSPSSLINTISVDNPIYVNIAVEQDKIYPLNLILAGKVKQDSIFFLQANNQTYPHVGKLMIVDRAVNPQTGTLKVQIGFQNADRILRSGMNVHVKVKNYESENQILIPYKAVVEQLGTAFVYKIKDSMALQQRVTLGRVIGSQVIIKSGLDPADVIAIQGTQNLKDSAKVIINNLH